MIGEGSLEVEKSSQPKEDQHASRVTRKKINTRIEALERLDTPNVKKIASRYVFPMVRGSWCSKSRVAEAAGAEAAVQQRNEKWHTAVARSAFNTSASKPFWNFRSQKMARHCGAKRISKSKGTKHLSAGPKLLMWRSRKMAHCGTKPISISQNERKTSVRDQFLMRRSRKMAHCGAKPISKSKCTKDFSAGPMFDVTISKNGTLWREAHF